MTVFPQLGSGAAAQFPFQRRLGFRTVRNIAGDGSESAFSDIDFEERLWELPFDDLTDAEWAVLKQFFEQVEGRLKGFTFLEPGSNLLSWSGDFDQPNWQKDPGIVTLVGQPDPTNGSGAIQISSGQSGVVRQTLAAPSWFRYTASVWAKGVAADAQLMVNDGAAYSVSTPFDVSGSWKRYSVEVGSPSTSEEVIFELFVSNGATLDVFGPQLEAQPYPSRYKATKAQGGLYSNARFDLDALTDRMTGLGRHSTLARILWTPSLI